MSKHTEILEEAAIRANSMMSAAHKAMGMEWELCGSQLVIRHLNARTPDLIHYGHYDVVDYGDEHVILVWVDEEGPQINRQALCKLGQPGTDEAYEELVYNLDDIQLPDPA